MKCPECNSSKLELKDGTLWVATCLDCGHQFSGTAYFDVEIGSDEEKKLTAKEFLSEVVSHKLDIIDEVLLEQFWFKEDGRVVANLGEKGGPVCGPILPYKIEGDDCIQIGKGGIQFSWKKFKMKGDRLSVMCDGDRKEFTISRAQKKRSYLP